MSNNRNFRSYFGIRAHRDQREIIRLTLRVETNATGSENRRLQLTPPPLVIPRQLFKRLDMSLEYKLASMHLLFSSRLILMYIYYTVQNNLLYFYSMIKCEILFLRSVNKINSK